MRNDVFGTITLAVSSSTDEKNETMALLATNYKYSPLLQKKIALIFEDLKGIISELTIHNVDVDFNMFFENK